VTPDFTVISAFIVGMFDYCGGFTDGVGRVFMDVCCNFSFVKLSIMSGLYGIFCYS
jgi:hypothetical protein